MAKLQYCGTGRRKSSVARVRLIPGSGVITVNKKPLDDYLAMEIVKREVKRPFEVAGCEGKFDVIATVRGRSGQRSIQSAFEGCGIPYERSSYEGKKEVRSQESKKSKPVLKEIAALVLAIAPKEQSKGMCAVICRRASARGDQRRRRDSQRLKTLAVAGVFPQNPCSCRGFSFVGNRRSPMRK